jgi:hypothetical protein
MRRLYYFEKINGRDVSLCVPVVGLSGRYHFSVFTAMGLALRTPGHTLPRTPAVPTYLVRHCLRRKKIEALYQRGSVPSVTCDVFESPAAGSFQEVGFQSTALLPLLLPPAPRGIRVAPQRMAVTPSQNSIRQRPLRRQCSQSHQQRSVLYNPLDRARVSLTQSDSANLSGDLDRMLRAAFHPHPPTGSPNRRPQSDREGDVGNRMYCRTNWSISEIGKKSPGSIP